DQHALDKHVWIALHQISIFECARLRLVRIADQILRLRRVFRHEAPFHAGRKTRTASPAQRRLLHFIDHVIIAHAVEDYIDRIIAAVTTIDVQRARVLEMNSAQLKWFTSDSFDTHDYGSASNIWSIFSGVSSS